MTKLTRKLFLSILTVVLTFIALGTTTFAWFTLGGTVTASGFKANVKTPDGIEISLNGTTWTNTIDLNAFINLVDITSANGHEFKKMDNTAATASTITGDDVPATGEDIYSGDYFSTKIYLRSTSNVVIDVASITANFLSTGTNWTADVPVTLTDTSKNLTLGATYLFDALNAVRVSFVPYTITSEALTETLTTANTKVIELASSVNKGTVPTQNEMFTTASGTTFSATTPYYTIANGVATLVGSPVVDDLATYYTKNSSLANTSLAFAYANAKGFAISSLVVPVAKNYLWNGSAFDATANILAATDYAAKSGNYYNAAFQLNIWLEGWDDDCINALLGLNDMTMSFSLHATF